MQPVAKGTRIDKSKLAIDDITNLQAPRDNKIALPETPGIRKNEKAMKPKITIKTLTGSGLMSGIISNKNPRPVPIKRQMIKIPGDE